MSFAISSAGAPAAPTGRCHVKDGIRAGKAIRVDGNYVINGRTYGVHDGTLYPVFGPGFHQLNRGAFQALGVLNKFGNTPQARSILARMQNVTSAEMEAALKAWSASR